MVDVVTENRERRPADNPPRYPLHFICMYIHNPYIQVLCLSKMCIYACMYVCIQYKVTDPPPHPATNNWAQHRHRLGCAPQPLCTPQAFVSAYVEIHFAQPSNISDNFHLQDVLYTYEITYCTYKPILHKLCVCAEIQLAAMPCNPYVLIADGKALDVLSLLEQDRSIASVQDEHGYSLLHAAASYNEVDLLRKLVRDYKVDVDVRDQDNETALFSVETVASAKVLVEELGADPLVTGDDGRTPAQAIEDDGDFPQVAAYLRLFQDSKSGSFCGGANGSARCLSPTPTPTPDRLEVRTIAVDESPDGDIPVEREVRARIEELASSEDFGSSESQAKLKQLVQDAVAQQGLGQARNIRPKTKPS